MITSAAHFFLLDFDEENRGIINGIFRCNQFDRVNSYYNILFIDRRDF